MARGTLRALHRPYHRLTTFSRLGVRFVSSVIIALSAITSADAARLLTNSNGEPLAVVQESSAITTITADFRRYPIGFFVSGLPQGGSANFTPESCYRDCSTQLTINASSSASSGNYKLIITGRNRSEQAATSLVLSITEFAAAIVNPQQHGRCDAAWRRHAEPKQQGWTSTSEF
jgi:hypothetical protein